MIGNMKYYVNNNNNNKIENSEKNEVNEKEILAKNSKKKSKVKFMDSFLTTTKTTIMKLIKIITLVIQKK